MTQDNFRSPYIRELADEIDKAILDYIEDNEPVSAEELLDYMSGDLPHYPELNHFTDYILDTNPIILKRLQFLKWQDLIPDNSVV